MAERDGKEEQLEQDVQNQSIEENKPGQLICSSIYREKRQIFHYDIMSAGCSRLILSVWAV